MLVLGMDEAGRGPVIGPMVMAGVVMEERDIHLLEEMGVKDSKKIAPAKREFLFDKIKEVAKDYVILKVSPEEIDEALASETMNLNWLEAVTSVKIINQMKPERAIVDCPSNNIEAYTEYMRSRLDDKSVELVVEHKADDTYVISGAASILAKVTRDREIEKLKAKYGDFGSGYPSDPKTKAFIEGNYQLPIFRRSWGTWKKVAEKQNQRALGDF